MILELGNHLSASLIFGQPLPRLLITVFCHVHRVEASLNQNTSEHKSSPPTFDAAEA